MKVFLIDFANKKSAFSAGATISTIALALALIVSILYHGDVYGDYVSTNGVGEVGRVIVIDAGHGGEDPGAIGVNGALEKDLNLAIAMLVGEQLSLRGYTVVYTRTDDRLLYSEDENIKGMKKHYDLKNRCDAANEYPESIFISIHMNSFGAQKYSGLQVYFKDGSDESRLLAESVRSRVVSDVQPENKRAVKGGDSFYVLKNTLSPAILVECGFLTNPEECKNLSEKEYQKKLSFSIVCGIIEYMEKN